MYNFVDTTERYPGQNLPSEALMFNGSYLENVIPGLSDTLCVRPGNFGYGDYRSGNRRV